MVGASRPPAITKTGLPKGIEPIASSLAHAVALRDVSLPATRRGCRAVIANASVTTVAGNSVERGTVVTSDRDGDTSSSVLTVS
jgi:hypothetical protein